MEILCNFHPRTPNAREGTDDSRWLGTPREPPMINPSLLEDEDNLPEDRLDSEYTADYLPFLELGVRRWIAGSDWNSGHVMGNQNQLTHPSFFLYCAEMSQLIENFSRIEDMYTRKGMIIVPHRILDKELHDKPENVRVIDNSRPRDYICLPKSHHVFFSTRHSGPNDMLAYLEFFYSNVRFNEDVDMKKFKIDQLGAHEVRPWNDCHHAELASHLMANAPQRHRDILAYATGQTRNLYRYTGVMNRNGVYPLFHENATPSTPISQEWYERFRDELFWRNITDPYVLIREQVENFYDGFMALKERGQFQIQEFVDNHMADIKLLPTSFCGTCLKHVPFYTKNQSKLKRGVRTCMFCTPGIQRKDELFSLFAAYQKITPHGKRCYGCCTHPYMCLYKGAFSHQQWSKTENQRPGTRLCKECIRDNVPAVQPGWYWTFA